MTTNPTPCPACGDPSCGVYLYARLLPAARSTSFACRDLERPVELRCDLVPGTDGRLERRYHTVDGPGTGSSRLRLARLRARAGGRGGENVRAAPADDRGAVTVSRAAIGKSGVPG